MENTEKDLKEFSNILTDFLLKNEHGAVILLTVIACSAKELGITYEEVCTALKTVWDLVDKQTLNK